MKKTTQTLLALIALIASSQAATVTLNASNPAGTDWTNNTYWSDNLAPSSGNDYIADAKSIRTPATTGDLVFAGDSLTLQNGGGITLKGTGTYTFSDLTINNGLIANGGGINGTIAGNISLTGALTVEAGGYNRSTNISANITSTATTTLTVSNFTSTNGAAGNSTFTGTNDFSGVTFSIDMNPNAYAYAGAFSTVSGNFTNAAGFNVLSGAIDFDTDFTNAAANLILASGAAITLDQDITVKQLVLDGTALAAGTYTFAELNASYDSYFTDGGSGSIIVSVAPEPSSLALLILGLGSLAFYRRRKA